MKTLTLKNKIAKTPKKENYKFKSYDITECGKRTIGISQSSFESFWNQLSKIDATRDEKEECLRHLKEACSWYSRGIAKFNREIEAKSEDVE